MGSISFDAGKIEATLDVDRTPFQTGLDQAKQQARDFADSRPTVTLDLDKTHAEAELHQFRDQLQQLNDRRVASPRIDLDTTLAEAHLRRFQEQLRGLNNESVRVDASGNATTGISDMEARLAALGRQVARPRIELDASMARTQLDDFRARLQALNGYRANPRVDLDGFAMARAQIDSLQRQLDQLSRTRATPSVGGINAVGSSASGAAGKVGGLMGALAALSPAIIPIAAVATGGIMGMAGAFTAAAAGAGLFGAAAKTVLGPVQDSMKKLTSLQQQYNLAVTDKQRQAILVKEKAVLDSLDPSQRKLLTNALGLKQAWTDMANSVKPQIYATANNVIAGLRNALGPLRPVLQSAADAFQQLSAGFERAMKGSTFTGFTQFLARQTGPAIATFGKALGDLGATFAHVLQAFEPLIRPAEDALTRFTGSIRKWSEGLGNNTGFQKFLGYIRENGPLVGRVLKDLWGAFTALVAAVAPLGPPILRAVDAILKFIKSIADSKGFHDFVDGLRKVLDGVTKLFTKITSDKGTMKLLSDGMSAVGKVLSALSPIIGFVSDHMTILKVLTVGIWGPFYALSKVIGLVSGVLGHLGDAFGAVGHFLSRARDDISNWAGDVQHAVSHFAQRAGHDIGNWASDAAGAVGRFASRAGSDVSNWASSAASHVANFATSAANHVGNFATSAVAHVANFASSASSRIGGFVSSSVSNLRGWVGNAASVVGSLPGRITGALGDLGHLLFDAGRRVIQGLIDGIKSAIGGIGSAMSGIAGKIRGFLPFSPAKEGPLSGAGAPNLAGRKIAAMLAEGLESGTDRLGAASNRLMSSAVFGQPAMAGGFGAAGAARAVGNATTYNLYGVGPDVTGQLRELERQRAFLLGA